jgi:hypothetical protein
VEQYRKARAVYETNTSTLSGKTRSVGLSFSQGGGAGVSSSAGTFFGVQQTVFAQQITPPKQPGQSIEEYLSLACGLIGMSGLLIGGMYAVAGGITTFVATCLLSGTFFFALFLRFRFLGIQRHKDKMRAYQEALNQYEHLWVCTRCGQTSTS